MPGGAGMPSARLTSATLIAPAASSLVILRSRRIGADVDRDRAVGAGRRGDGEVKLSSHSIVKCPGVTVTVALSWPARIEPLKVVGAVPPDEVRIVGASRYDRAREIELASGAAGPGDGKAVGGGATISFEVGHRARG